MSYKQLVVYWQQVYWLVKPLFVFSRLPPSILN